MAIDPHLKIGEACEFSKTIAESDLMLFAGISGDFDPIHVNEEFASKTAFGRRIAHGALVMSLCSTTSSMMSRRSIERAASLCRSRSATTGSASSSRSSSTIP